MMLTLFSIIGTLLLAFSNVPQAIKSCLEKNSNGVSLLTLIIGIFGLLSLFVYITFTYFDFGLMFNYGFNVIILGIILYWKVFPK